MRIRIEAIGFKGNIVDSARFEQELFKAVNKTLEAAEKDFKKTIRTWTTEVRFRIVRARVTQGKIEGAVGTDSKIYKFVTRGTKPHVIRPRFYSLLRFQTGYRAKTRPRFLGSSKGGASGSTVFAKEVHHPGTVAREFEQEIDVRHQTTLEDNVLAGMKRAARQRRT